MQNAIFASTLLFYIVFCAADLAFGFSLEQFIMPGPLSAAHAKYEKECEKCHDSLDKSKHREKCLECHKEIFQDITQSSGFHGKNKRVGDSECHHCHTEHIGRDGTIILMDLDNFDHVDTDFLLKDAHKKIRCGLCHERAKKYRELKHDCFFCHQQTDPHAGSLGQQCQDCHQETEWKKHKFDHQKTKFQLSGVHMGHPCFRCHAKQKWKNLPLTCVGCHQANDIHSGGFGAACEKCHVNDQDPAPLHKKGKSGWTVVKFDHGKTKYKLIGGHEKATCIGCHKNIKLKPEEAKDKKVQSCFSCHQQGDTHKGRFGQDCEKCHTPAVAWTKPTFQHEKTKFPLLDSHKKVPCIKCHTGALFQQKLAHTCVSCHRLDDRHAGSFGDACEKCHAVVEWKKVNFDHNTARYKLIGRHQEVSCKSCHYGIPAGTRFGGKCIYCHASNDPHKGQLGDQCQKCHNEMGWREKVFFDHDLTSFPLLGMHGVAPCEACHLDNTYKDTAKTCRECHFEQDKHKGKFGISCARCHTPNNWNIWNFNHDTQSKFPLTGAHSDLNCIACHKKSVDQVNHTPKNCKSCHGRDDVHRGKFGKFCDRCHITKTFKSLLINR